MRHDLLSNAMSIMKNAEDIGKKFCIIPASKLIKNILKIIKDNNYIQRFEFIDNNKGGKFKVVLKGRINQAGSIRPRFSVKKDEYEKWERRYLPAPSFGILIVSTPAGIMDQKHAEKEASGGKLLAYIY